MTSPSIALVLDKLGRRGLSPRPLSLYGQPAALTWKNDVEDSFGDEALVVVPDMHLSDGGAGDVFARGASVIAGRDARKDFAAFLAGLVDAKSELAKGGKPGLRMIQLGDFYDIWRAYPEYRNRPSRDFDKIERTYRPIIDTMVGPLDARFCVGNHDSVLGLYPPQWATGRDGRATSRIGYGQRMFGGDVLALHGHQGSELVEAFAAQHGGFFVSLGTWLAGLGPLAGPVERLELALDHSDDDGLGTAPKEWPEAPPPKIPYSSVRWSKRDGADTIGKILAAVQSQGIWKGKLPRFVFVGHSHRPGIASCTVGDAILPLVDVGSFTYGRTQFALAAKGEISLWELG